MLQSLNLFLERFEKLTPPDSFVRKATSLAVKEETEIDIPPEKISYSKNGTLHLKVGSHERNILFMNKEKILENIQRRVNEKGPKDLI